MATHVVWMLMMFFPAEGGNRTPMVIDNIATEADCQSVAMQVRRSFAAYSNAEPNEAVCMSVNKVGP